MNSLNVKHQGKTLNNWHFTCQLTCIYENFKKNISEAYKVLRDCLKDSYDKNNMKEKVKLGSVTQSNAIKIHSSIIFRTNPNSYLGT